MVFGYEVFFKLKNLSKFSPATLLVSPMSRFLPLFKYRDIVYRRETFSHEKKKLKFELNVWPSSLAKTAFLFLKIFFKIQK